MDFDEFKAEFTPQPEEETPEIEVTVTDDEFDDDDVEASLSAAVDILEDARILLYGLDDPRNHGYLHHYMRAEVRRLLDEINGLLYDMGVIKIVTSDGGEDDDDCRDECGRGTC